MSNEEKARLVRQRYEEDLARSVEFCLKSPETQEFIWWVLTACNLSARSEKIDGQAGIIEGRRQVGLEVVQLLSLVDRNAYPKMMMKANERESVRESVNVQDDD